jgi:MFS superfamily sulfate permease-like transporter
VRPETHLGEKLHANAELFKVRALEAVAASPARVRWFVVAAEPVSSVDVTAADMLTELNDELSARGIQLCIAEMEDPVKDKLKRFGLFTHLGEQRFFLTVSEAVSAYLATRSIDSVEE